MEDKNIIHKFGFYHPGGDILISDVVSEYEEVKEKFKEKVKSKYVTNHHILKDLDPGHYDTYLIETDMGKWGKRVTGLYFLNSNYDPKDIMTENNDNWRELFDFGVDGGTCMFLSESVLNHRVELDVFLEKWMSCQYPGNYLKLELNHKTLGFGTQTGFGDGMYYFFGYYQMDKLIGVKVFFVDDDSDSE